MNNTDTAITTRDLNRQAPHSPRERFGGFAILGRTVDKCRASIAGKLGEYHYDCPLDNQLFSFKGVNGDQFKKAVITAKSYGDVATWLQSNGTPKTPEEIKTWSDKAEATTLKDAFKNKTEVERKDLRESCRQLGIDFDSATLFDWLEADDEAAFEDEATAK